MRFGPSWTAGNKPPVGTPVNWGHILAPRFYMPFSEGGGQPYDQGLKLRQLSPFGTPAVWQVGPRGQQRSYAGAGTADFIVDQSLAGPINAARSFTSIIGFVPDAVSSVGGTGLSFGNFGAAANPQSGAQAHTWVYRHVANRFSYWFNVNNLRSGANDIVAGTPYQVGIRFDKSLIEWTGWVDGKKDAAVSSGNDSGTNNTFFLGDGFGGKSQGAIFYAAIWDYALPDWAFAYLVSDPYCFLVQPKSLFFLKSQQGAVNSARANWVANNPVVIPEVTPAKATWVVNNPIPTPNVTPAVATWVVGSPVKENSSAVCRWVVNNPIVTATTSSARAFFVSSSLQADSLSNRIESLEATLTLPDGSKRFVESASYHHQVYGDKWSCVLGEALDLSEFDDDDTFFLEVITARGTFLSPPLHCTQPRVTTGLTYRTEITGTDRTSWFLGLKGFTQGTFLQPNVLDVIQRISLLTGVPIFGAPPVQIPSYDLQSGTMQEHLSRLLRDAGFKYKIGPNGEVICFPFSSRTVTNRPMLFIDTVHALDLTAAISILRIRKASKFDGPQRFDSTNAGTLNQMVVVDGQLSAPLKASSIEAIDTSTGGSSLGFATFLDAADGICRFFSFNPNVPGTAGTTTPNSSQPAVKVRFGCLLPNVAVSGFLCQLTVNGVPEGEIGDPAFEIDFPFPMPVISASSPPAFRTRIEVLESPLFLTIAATQAMAAALWQEAQKDYETLQVGVVIDPGFDVGEEIPAGPRGSIDSDDPGYPAGICEDSSFSFGPGGVSHTLSGYVPKAIPPGGQAVLVPRV